MNISGSTRKSLNTDFVGRKYAFDAIEKLWTTPSSAPRSMLLWGEWSIGKSEVLWNIDNRCQRITVAYSSLQCLGNDHEEKYIWQMLTDSVKGATAVEAPSDCASLANPFVVFSRYIERVLKTIPSFKLLLAIDQYEAFLDIPEAATILWQIEELTLKYDRLGFLLCGSHHSDQVAIGFKPAKELWLGAFTKEETIQFVNQQPYKFDPDAADLLHDLTGGRPWLVRGLCFNVIFELNELPENRPELRKLVTVSTIENAIATDNTYRSQDT